MNKAKEKFKYIKRPAWLLRLHRMKSLLLTYTFPSRAGYYGSCWAEWERRIQTGHRAEAKEIEERYGKWGKRLAESPARDPSFDLDELAGEDYWQTRRLSNSMYAALVVSLWADMEEFLKEMICIYNDVLSLAKKVPYKFGPIKEFYCKTMSVDIASLFDYSVVDALRILNNSFKHNDGYYMPKVDEAHTHISQALLDEWGILVEHKESDKSDKPDEPDKPKEIDYTKLPIENLVLACNAFCRDLLTKVEPELKRHTGAKPEAAGEIRV